MHTPVTAEGKESVKVTTSAARQLVVTSATNKHKPFSIDILSLAYSKRNTNRLIALEAQREKFENNSRGYKLSV